MRVNQLRKMSARKISRSKIICVFIYVRGEKESIGSGLLRAKLAQNRKKLLWVFFIRNCFPFQKAGGDLFTKEENFCFTEGQLFFPK